jgi:hypothetical protein
MLNILVTEDVAPELAETSLSGPTVRPLTGKITKKHGKDNAHETEMEMVIQLHLANRKNDRDEKKNSDKVEATKQKR